VCRRLSKAPCPHEEASELDSHGFISLRLPMLIIHGWSKRVSHVDSELIELKSYLVGRLFPNKVYPRTKYAGTTKADHIDRHA
jgi:hypothetical protein